MAHIKTGNSIKKTLEGVSATLQLYLIFLFNFHKILHLQGHRIKMDEMPTLISALIDKLDELDATDPDSMYNVPICHY